MRVAELLAERLSYAEVADRLGISKPTVCFHARRLGIPARKPAAGRYDWEAIRRHYEDGHSVRDCIARFGFSTSAWADAVRRGAVIPREQVRPLEEVFVASRMRKNGNHLKGRLIKAGLKENRCEACGITEWMGQPLNMELHHLNGDRLDNRLENLQLLCGNCHTQTDNWGGRGRLRPGGER